MKEDICKHCFEPESNHHASEKWCTRKSERGHFTSWNTWSKFEGINIFKELERLKNWQQDAIFVLNKWYKVSEFLANNNMVGLGEDYSTKCLEVLQRLKSTVDEEPRFNRIVHLERTNSDLLDEVSKLRKQLASITGSMAAHPDCIEGSEFWDIVRISEKILSHEYI